MSALLVAAAGLGLASAPHCMGMCGPLAATCAGRTATAVSYQLARIATYTGLGSVAATLVGSIRERLPQSVSSVVLAVAIAISLVLSAYRLLATPSAAPRLVQPSELTKARRRFEFPRAIGLGVATGLLPCGSLYGALALASLADSALHGAAAMFVFGLVSGLALVLTQAAYQRLRAADGTGPRRLLASVLIAGAFLALSRPVLDAGGEPDCHQVSIPSTRSAP